jgi:hypothetical protein
MSMMMQRHESRALVAAVKEDLLEKGTAVLEVPADDHGPIQRGPSTRNRLYRAAKEAGVKITTGIFTDEGQVCMWAHRVG